jgi:hypothetical protein
VAVNDSEHIKNAEAKRAAIRVGAGAPLRKVLSRRAKVKRLIEKLAQDPAFARVYAVEIVERRLPPKDMARQLEIIEFGTRAQLALRSGRASTRSEALSLAAQEMNLGGSESVSDSTLSRRWSGFVRLSKEGDFVPYWEVDPITGSLLPTAIVLSELPRAAGRPRNGGKT